MAKASGTVSAAGAGAKNLRADQSYVIRISSSRTQSQFKKESKPTIGASSASEVKPVEGRRRPVWKHTGSRGASSEEDKKKIRKHAMEDKTTEESKDYESWKWRKKRKRGCNRLQMQVMLTKSEVLLQDRTQPERILQERITKVSTGSEELHQARTQTRSTNKNKYHESGNEINALGYRPTNSALCVHVALSCDLHLAAIAIGDTIIVVVAVDLFVTGHTKLRTQGCWQYQGKAPHRKSDRSDKQSIQSCIVIGRAKSKSSKLTDKRSIQSCTVIKGKVKLRTPKLTKIGSLRHRGF